ncbi:MAG: pteridine reductase [Neptuniibacter caesariensis]|uniref:Pteridine reductase n=1 Tax=Neptuniibacter caesariensis TaxID=207954 RepID=A0A2G6JN74_NEPCE|nr:MAG: pteridine reductase [Neptuniibacter caesariensis]
MNSTSKNPVALVTGAAKRVGRAIASELHQAGYHIAIHYHNSETEAQALKDELNAQRHNSAETFSADLSELTQLQALSESVLAHFGQLNLLVNNASSFFPTPVEHSSPEQWDDLLNTNLRAPYFLSSYLSPALQQSAGSIINLIDIHSQRGLPDFPIYSISKAGVEMMTKSLAKELAPKVRVNGISPGAILWPEADLSEGEKQAILNKTLLGRIGRPKDLAEAVLYLSQAEYITGQILAIDGGKSLYSH